jgi:2-keto-myo-inositol isomerase
VKVAISQITTLPADLELDLPAFARAGFTAAELSLEKVNRFVAKKSVTALQELLAELGLNAVGAIGLAPLGPALLLSRGAQFQSYFKSLKDQLALCRSLNIDQIGIGADATKWVLEDNWRADAVKNLKLAAQLASDFGMRIGLEFMSLDVPIGPFVLDSLVSTQQITEAVAHPAIGINIDFFHHYRSGGSVQQLSKLEGTQIVDVHVTDVAGGKILHLDDGARLLPDKGVLPLSEYREAILATGYKEYWTLELLNEDLWSREVSETAQLAADAMASFVS